MLQLGNGAEQSGAVDFEAVILLLAKTELNREEIELERRGE